MALYDNKYWLLSHIRNSFISTDDTGMCELVMVGETLPKHLVQELDIYPDSEDEDEEDEIEHESYDIQLDTDFSVHRQRSNTTLRLERMDQARKRAAKITNVKWDNNIQCTNENVNEYFVKKDLVGFNNQLKVSLLSKQLEKCTSLPQNPYIEYAKYDGTAQVGQTVRKYKIYLTMLPEEQRNYPLEVSCLATAIIQEFIGLILLKCSTMHGGIPLLSPTEYRLYIITEDDGEVDRDFPCLNMNECVAKFGFPSLGLVEVECKSADGGGLAKRVSFDQPRVDGDGGLDSVDNASVVSPPVDDRHQLHTDNAIMRAHTNAMEAPLYKSFLVYIIHRLRGRIAVHLGISGDKIEIDPIASSKSSGHNISGGKLFAAAFIASGGGRKKQKAVSHLIDTVAWCEMVDSHGSGKHNRRLFRIVYSTSFGGGNGASGNTGLGQSADQNGPGTLSPQLQTSASFKHYDFEADDHIAKEIVQKVSQILELRSSASRKEYLESLERKKFRRSNFF